MKKEEKMIQTFDAFGFNKDILNYKKRKYNIDTSNLIFADKKAVSTFTNLNLTVKEELKKHG